MLATKAVMKNALLAQRRAQRGDPARGNVALQVPNKIRLPVK